MTIGPSDRTMLFKSLTPQRRSPHRRWIAALLGLVLLLVPGIAAAAVHGVHGAPAPIVASDLGQPCDTDGASGQHDAHPGCVGGIGCTLVAVLCEGIATPDLRCVSSGRFPAIASAGRDIIPLTHPPRPVQR